MTPEEEFWELFGSFGVGADGTPLQLSVRTCTGQGSAGPIYAEPADHSGLPQMPVRQLSRSTDGNTAMASGTALLAPLRLLEVFAVNSLVTLDTGRQAVVTGAAVADQAGLFEFVRVDLA